MTEAMKKLILTIAFQRQAELQMAMGQMDQAVQMTQDPNEQQFLAQQRGQMEYMLRELTEAINGANTP